MKPLLAHTYSPKRWPSGLPCWVQPKLNGVRALYQVGVFQSRDELPWNPNVLAHLTNPLKRMFPDERIILDGELYVHGWSLQRINGAVQIARREPREDTHLVEFHVFDVVNFQSPFERRIRPVFKTLWDLQHPKVKMVPTVSVTTQAEADEHYNAFVTDGYEGMMYRIGLCPYTWPSMGRKISDKDNRVWHLLKRKDWQDREFECIAVEEGEGKRAGMVGAFICRIDGLTPRHEGNTRSAEFRVGSGLTDAEATEYFINQPVGRFIKVKYLCLSQDGIPLNPTIEAVL